jgi:hypothetical protein
MLSKLSIRVRLLLASTVVQVVMLTLLLTNSGRLINEATTASLNTLIAQNAAILNVVTAAFVPQGRYQDLQDALGELGNETMRPDLRPHRRQRRAAAVRRSPEMDAPL